MTKTKRILGRVLAMALSLLLIISMIPVNAVFAADLGGEDPEGNTGDNVGGDSGLPTVDGTITEDDYTLNNLYTYDGEPHGIVIDAPGFTVEYEDADGNWVDTCPTYVDAGSYIINCRISGEGYHTLVMSGQVLNILSAEITDITVSETANVYDGTELPLVTLEGVQEGDIVTYKVNGEESESATAVNAGSYEVTVTVDRGSNYKVFEHTVTSEIELGDLDLGDLKVEGLEGVYNGSAQDAVIITDKGDYTLQFKLDDGEWTDTVPTVTEAGSYTVEVKAIKNNYNDKDVAVDKAPSAVIPFNVYVAKAEQEGFEFEIKEPEDLAYKGTLENKADGGQTDGEITYEVVEGAEYVSVDENGMITVLKAGGEVTVKATRTGDSNYKDAVAVYTIKTIKAAQSDFAFEQAEYTVQYGTKELTVVAKGGQSEGAVTYEIADGDLGVIVSEENEGKIAFASGKKGEMTVVATLDGGENYENITAEAVVKVLTNDFSSMVAVDERPASGWYTNTVSITPAEGYKISGSAQFDAEWKDIITVAPEGKNTVGDVYLIEEATGYISEAIAVEDIYIDKTYPTDLAITYSSSVIDIILENISFGFYKSSATVTLTATDLVSKIDHLEYRIGEGEIVTVTKDKLTFSGENNEIAEVSFEIPANLSRSKITMTAVDAAGFKTTIVGDKTLVVDDFKPVISVSFDNNTAFHDSYFQGSRTATITIDEENFFKDDLYNLIPGTEVQYLTITVGKRVGNEDDYTKTVVNLEFTKVGDAYEATYTFEDDADYTFDVVFFDYSLNENASVDYGESVAPTAFTIDNTDPSVEISYDDTDAVESEANKGYFKGSRQLIITVTEHNFNAEELDFSEFFGKNAANADVEVDDIEAIVEYFKTPSNWTSEGDVHKASYPLAKEEADANYAIKLNYNDLADNAAETEESVFCLDNVAPFFEEGAEISYSASLLDTILEAITFGFYNSEMEVTITAYDETAGIDYFTYSYTVSEDGHKDDAGKSDVVIPNSEITFEDGAKKASATFKIPEQFRGYVSFTATDKSNNTSDTFTDEKCIVVDNVISEIIVTYDNNEVKNGEYYDADRTATIKISADNFFKDNLYTPVMKNDEEGTPVAQDHNYLIITVGKQLNDESKYTYTDIMPAFERDGDYYKATVEFNENADYTFNIKYTDKSLNVYDSYEMDKFTIDKIAPEMKVEFTEPDHENENQYRADREATITVDEHNFDAKDIVVNVIAESAQAQVFDYVGYMTNNENWDDNGDIHTIVIPFSTEAHYTFDIDYKDLAGNAAEDFEPVEFTIDKTAPTAMNIKIADVSVNGVMTDHAFNKFYGAAVTVKLSANCDISGLETLKYQKVADISDYDENGEWTDYNDETGIVVNPSEKFVIYFRAEDRAGNVSIIRSTGIVVDDQKPVGETHAPEIDIIPGPSNANGMYKGDVNVDLKVVDPKYTGAAASDNGHYSGINKITYKIYTTDTDAVEEGILLDLATKTAGAVFDADKLVSSWSGNITIDSEKFNSNNVIVEITAIDNAGNERKTTTAAGDIKIDITAPEILVSYDNNAADSDTFFKDDRTATVVITERNFKAEDVVVTITNTDGVIPVISAFTKKAGTGNCDDTTWTATIKYTADGDYEFDINYTDLAENACAGETFANGTVASNAFTIDHIDPVIAVRYDNNSALNGNYYKAVRTATVVITEHNFNAERVTVTHTATDDGATAAMPTVSAWTSNGDTHTATIYYGKDAKYTFDIAVVDKAGNESADYTEETFFVDTTMPTLDITGIADKSANNGDVIPVISYSDTNYDAGEVTITLTGANRKAVELDGSYADIHNGRTFTFNNFAKEKEIDDIYTLTASLTDKAGNTTEKTIVFSVNRFGSTYALSEAAEALNGTYVKEPIDVVITETNADELSNIKVILFKDGETKVLEEGADYKIDIEGGNGQWYQYTYTVFAANFDADGVYSLTVESDDKAGNEAKNDQDTKDTAINFGVDSTLPIINIENLESNTTYALDNMTVTMNVKDNLKLTKVIAELDGNTYKTWEGEELEKIIKNGGNFSFDISGESTASHKLVVYAVDAAGNGEKISEANIPANAEQVEDFYVTTDFFVRYYTNKPLFYGSIAGVVVLAGLIVFLVVYKRKKNGEK